MLTDLILTSATVTPSPVPSMHSIREAVVASRQSTLSGSLTRRSDGSWVADDLGLGDSPAEPSDSYDLPSLRTQRSKSGTTSPLGWTLNPTWDFAAEQIVYRMEKTVSPRNANLGLLTYWRDRMAESVRRGEEPTSLLWLSIADEAIAELMDMREWDADAFVELLVSKQRDYGHENINAFGLIGVAVRLCDKIARFINLTAQAADAVNEPLTDTLRDMVGYAVIAEMLSNGTFALELAS